MLHPPGGEEPDVCECIPACYPRAAARATRPAHTPVTPLAERSNSCRRARVHPQSPLQRRRARDGRKAAKAAKAAGRLAAGVAPRHGGACAAGLVVARLVHAARAHARAAVGQRRPRRWARRRRRRRRRLWRRPLPQDCREGPPDRAGRAVLPPRREGGRRAGLGEGVRLADVAGAALGSTPRGAREHRDGLRVAVAELGACEGAGGVRDAARCRARGTWVLEGYSKGTQRGRVCPQCTALGTEGHSAEHTQLCESQRGSE